MIRVILSVRATSCLLYNSTRSMVTAVDKATLSKLRKRTGISFINCKKALEQFENDLEKAEKWLQEQAMKEGWAKATKLQSRSMSSGLVALVHNNHAATMIEVNCETDFVAKNKKFVSLTTLLARECHQAFLQQVDPLIVLDKTVGRLQGSEGQTLADLVAMEVGSIGENMLLRRAVHLKQEGDDLVSTYVHAAGPEISSEADCKLGKYGVVVNLREKQFPGVEHLPSLNVEHLSHLIGQHIVGMNPKTMGNEEYLSNVKDANEEGSETTDKEEKEENKEEDRLLYQEFLLDPSITVKKLLKDHGVVINTFYRFECGEELPGDEKQD